MTEKKILCPYCKADLKKAGFRTVETVYTTFEWEWSKTKGYFNSDDGETDNSDVDNAFCNNCDKDILDFVRENDLI